MNKEKETHHIWTSGEDWWQRVLDDENTRLTRRCDVEHGLCCLLKLSTETLAIQRYSRIAFTVKFIINGIMTNSLNINKCIKNSEALFNYEYVVRQNILLINITKLMPIKM